MGDIFCLSYWACFNGSGLKDIVHLLVQRPTLWRFLFSFCELLIGSLTTKSIEVLSLYHTTSMIKTYIRVKEKNNQKISDNTILL